MVSGVSAGYDAEMVLKDIDLTIPHGQVTSILGPSGCGKSTLLKTFMGMLRPSSGTVSVLGKDVLKMEREELSKFLTRMGITFQQGALFGSMTIADNIAAPIREHTDLSNARIRAIVRMKLGLVSLMDAEHRMPSELSGGMQKRAAIARSLALDPDILLFDEPSAGLDPVTCHELDKLILSLNESLGCTVVVVTHKISSAVRISDRIVFLDEGHIIEDGSVADFLESSDSRVRDFAVSSGVSLESVGGGSSER